MRSNHQTEFMSKAPVRKAILKMSLPVVLGMMVSMLYNLVDTFFIGKLHDPNQLAAANIASPITMVMMAVTTIVSTGAASYISRCLGKNDKEQANQTLSTGIAICIGLGIVIMILGMVFLDSFIVMLGATEDTFLHVYRYVFVILMGTIPVMLSYAGGQLLRSEGAVMPSMLGMLIGTVTNIILDPIFIFVFKMEITGAAIATVLGNVFSTAFYAYYYLSGKTLIKLKWKYICREKEVWGQTFAIGIPAAMSQLLVSIAMIICNNLAKPYGEIIRGGMGISAKLMYIGTFIFMGFAAGCQPLIGFNYGAGNLPRVKDVLKNGMIMTAGIGTTLTIIFGFFAPSLVSIFSDSMTEVIEAGSTVLRTYMWSFIVLGPQMITSTSIQSFGKAKASLFLSIARQGLFYIPLLFTLNRHFGFQGLLWAQPLSDTITLTLGITLLTRILKSISETKISAS